MKSFFDIAAALIFASCASITFIIGSFVSRIWNSNNKLPERNHWSKKDGYCFWIIGLISLLYGLIRAQPMISTILVGISVGLLVYQFSYPSPETKKFILSILSKFAPLGLDADMTFNANMGVESIFEQETLETNETSKSKKE